MDRVRASHLGDPGSNPSSAKNYKVKNGNLGPYNTSPEMHH